jgi:hypothetical protein
LYSLKYPENFWKLPYLLSNGIWALAREQNGWRVKNNILMVKKDLYFKSNGRDLSS